MGRPRKYTDAERAAALRDYELFGPSYVEDTHGIKKSTVATWAKEAGIRTIRNDVMIEAHAARQLDLKLARRVILQNLYVDTMKEQAKYWDPSIVWSFGGKDNTFEQHTFEEPTSVDKKIRAGIITSNINAAVKLEAVDSNNGVDEGISVLMQLAAALGIGGNTDEHDEEEEEPSGAAGATGYAAEDSTES